ncbi:MAG: hypothetical protein U1E10_06300 [Bdellovibrionales bacterium]|nr:hypothetical protein [Bdellovibrionales bacterium]
MSMLAGFLGFFAAWLGSVAAISTLARRSDAIWTGFLIKPIRGTRLRWSHLLITAPSTIIGLSGGFVAWKGAEVFRNHAEPQSAIALPVVLIALALAISGSAALGLFVWKFIFRFRN